MTGRQRFPITAALVLIIGLIAVVAIIPFASFFYPAKSVTSVEQAKGVVDSYLFRVSSDLEVKEIMEFSNHFYVMVQEKSTGINAFELLVDRNTGNIFYEPGPNMMWNTKYGHMGWTRNPTASMPITPQEASGYAQRWLDRNIPGAKAEEPEKFYGYYTIDISKNNQILGMLSVDGYSGDVWYHTWHGRFIKLVEYD